MNFTYVCRFYKDFEMNGDVLIISVVIAIILSIFLWISQKQEFILSYIYWGLPTFTLYLHMNHVLCLIFSLLLQMQWNSITVLNEDSFVRKRFFLYSWVSQQELLFVIFYYNFYIHRSNFDKFDFSSMQYISILCVCKGSLKH